MWTKFGQMTGKVILKIKRPKNIKAKAMSMAQNAKSKVKGYSDKAIGAYKSAYKKRPLTTGVSTVIAGSLAAYPLVKDTEIVQSRVRMRKEAKKIKKEIKSGKKVSFKEKYKRMSESGTMRSFP